MENSQSSLTCLLVLLLHFQEELIEICRLVAESKLSEGKHQEALPAAQFYLACSKDVYGTTAVELVPAYLLLADANIGEEEATNVFLFLQLSPLFA